MGNTITVTDHGRLVARIVPAGTPIKLEQLIAQGKITPPKRRKSKRRDPIKTAGGMVSDLIDEQRQ